MEKIISAILLGVGIMVVAAGIGLFMAVPLMWCWNYAVVATFSLPALTWGKAWCLNFVCSYLIKSTLNITK